MYRADNNIEVDDVNGAWSAFVPWWVAELELAKAYPGVYRGPVDLGKVVWHTRALILAAARNHSATMGDKKKK